MTMTIDQALKALDPKNDEHWTSDGSPRMDKLQELTGDESLTRKQVKEAAPTFTRETAGEAPPEDPGVSQETEQGATAAPPSEETPAEDQEKAQEDAEETPPADDQEQPEPPVEEIDEDAEEALAEESELTKELEAVDAELAEAEAELNERRKDADKIRARRDQLIAARERERTPHEDQIERMRFIKRQAALRAERAGQNALAAELAMQARGLSSASPLDQSMARRMGRGRDRPAARPLKIIKE